MSAAGPIRLLIADDSAGIRSALKILFRSQTDVEIIAAARNGREAVELVKRHHPDIVLMDLEMPEMNGTEAIREIMRDNPLPIIVFSSIARDTGPRTFEALEAGAVDFVTKDASGSALDIGGMREAILRKIRKHAGAKLPERARSPFAKPQEDTKSFDALLDRIGERASRDNDVEGMARVEKLRKQHRETLISQRQRDADRAQRAGGNRIEGHREVSSFAPRSRRSPHTDALLPPIAYAERAPAERAQKDKPRNTTTHVRGHGEADTRQRRIEELVARGPSSEELRICQREIERKRLPRTAARLVVVGGSTGGPQAIHAIVRRLPHEFPLPIVVAQHMPASFTETFAQRLRDLHGVDVKIVKRSERLLPRCLYLAPGGQHVRVSSRAGTLYADVMSEDLAGLLHKPSVDMLFRSALEAASGSVIALVLSGMGRDGASAAADLHKSGATVIVQDEATSSVWGMPRAVHELNAADMDLPLHEIGDVLAMLLHVRRNGS